MDKVPVQVKVHTWQQLEDGTAETFSTQAKGFLYLKGESLFITYQETDQEGNSGQTTWKVEKDRATLIRQGAASLRILLHVGHAELTTLVTTYGNLPVEIVAERLENNLSNTGGHLRVSYRMDLAGAVTQMDLQLQVDSYTD